MKSRALLLVALLAALLGFALACSSDGGEDTPVSSATDVVDLETPTPAPSTPPNPILHDEGIEVTTVGSTMPGWPVVTRTCKADGYVGVRDGNVVSIVGGPDQFKPEIGEPVYRADGSRFVDPTLVTQPAYRTADGKLVDSWRECVVSPEDYLQCDGDGEVWVRDGSVVEVVTQPSGREVTGGELVYGPDDLALSSSVLTLVPAFRADDDRLMYGWSKCEVVDEG